MVNRTLPRARQNFATTASSRFLDDAEATARELLGRTLTTARGGVAGAAAAQADATQALSDAAAAQATADGAAVAAGAASGTGAAAQATADTKLNLATASTISTDAPATFTASVSHSLVFHTGTLTADRTITLSAATNKWQARFVRTGSGAFNLSIGGLKNLTTGTWCDVYYNGSAWELTASGTL